MLTSAGGILALLKDQNQVRYRVFFFLNHKIINIMLKHVNMCLTGGESESPTDPVRPEEVGLGGR